MTKFRRSLKTKDLMIARQGRGSALADMRAAGELSTAAQLASVLIVGMNLYGYLLRQIHH